MLNKQQATTRTSRRNKLPTSPLTDVESLSPLHTGLKKSQPSDREVRLQKDRLRKQKSKEKAVKELHELKRLAEELTGQLHSLQQRKRKAMSTEEVPIDWKQAALVAKQHRIHGEAEYARLFNELLFAFEKGVLYRSLSWNRSESQMLLDHRCDPWVLHSLPANPSEHASALHRLSEHQLSKFTPEVYAKLPDSVSGSPFGIVLDECGQDIAFLEMFKYGLVRSHFRDVAESVYAEWLPRDESKAGGRKMTFFDNNLVLSTSTDPQGKKVQVVYHLRFFDKRAIWTQRTIVFDQESGSVASRNVGGWIVFEDVSDAQGVKCAMRGYTQVFVDTPASTASHEYTKIMNGSTSTNAAINRILERFGSIALN
ncbi:hypothetical protein LEN26_018995 [Aphanomyces euteiches]|nr:hypothetical protein LEN26_018995 [Aphanomyces euteiches]KAH9129782.1 hypothetical protein AeMF1_000202 [Aphanomyces euteiches]KAH9195906.1 hypothetical protein AeNC1_002131 [Aphanomyces euteiches]